MTFAWFIEARAMAAFSCESPASSFELALDSWEGFPAWRRLRESRMAPASAAVLTCESPRPSCHRRSCSVHTRK